jgi:hypothetical protein
MKSLEEEAEEYAENYDECDIWLQGAAKECYIAGANSKWVQVEKIKAQIDILNKHRLSGEEKFSDTIEELEQQLKQLEDENDTIQT